jgi:monoamine oxidase
VSRKGKRRSSIDALLREHGRPSNAASVVPSFSVALSMVVRSGATTVAPSRFAAVFLDHGALVRFVSPMPLPEVAIAQLWHGSNTADQPHQWLRSCGALASHISGGSAGLCDVLAARLGDRVVTGTPVAAIRQTVESVEVDTIDGTWRARRAVLAMDPALVNHIAFEPGLPSARISMQRTWAMGSGIKAHFCYDEPFWRRDGLSGQSYANTGYLRTTFDVTPPDGPGVLVTFLGHQIPEHARLVDLTADQRRDAALAELAIRFGPAARQPVRYLEQDWTREPFQSGCIARPGPGTLSAAGELIHQPVGRLHFAGAETSRIWEGHMEGAVRSAERATSELLNIS